MPEFNIVLAISDTIIRKVLTRRFKDTDYTILEAKDGNEAISRIESENVHLVVAEEMLPYHNGFELIGISKSRNIPVIIISDADLEEKLLEAFELGADDFIDKPFSPNELFVRVKNQLKRQETT
tara:strand:+ start:15015 stop:15386 length:372 start_codon:yes stop_codon:yes gene_type:complete